MNNKTHYSPVIKYYLRERVRNNRPLKLLDGDQALINYLVEMEHFMALALPMQELRGVFNSEQVSTAIKQYNSAQILQALDEVLSSLSTGVYLLVEGGI